MLLFHLSALLSVVAASGSAIGVPNFRIPASSQIGSKLLSKARRLEDEDEDEDFSWMSGYTIKFERCFSGDICQEDDEDCGEQTLVSFSICPESSSCVAGCSDGEEGVVGMEYFIDAFTESQLGAREYACEMARENCDDDGDCYGDGLDYCEDNEDEFNLQEWLECKEFEDDYYVGPYCADDGENIYLGFFTDEDCTYQADEGTYEDLYGQELEYSTYSIVTDECANCREHGLNQDQVDGDQEDEDDVLEQCEDLYKVSQGCADGEESNACTYIAETAEIIKSSSASSAGNNKAKKSKAGIIIAIILGSIAAAACCWFGHKKKSGDAPLLDTEAKGGVAA